MIAFSMVALMAIDAIVAKMVVTKFRMVLLLCAGRPGGWERGTPRLRGANRLS